MQILMFVRNIHQRILGIFFKLSHPFCFTGNDELVKALIFDAVVTKDFENQKSPRRGGKDMV